MRRAFVGLLVVAAWACTDLGGLSGGTSAPPDASTSPDATTTDTDGGTSTTDEDAATPNDAGCPSGMVSAGTFCIDATEVTRDRYAAFLAANAGTVDTSGPCGFKKSNTPGFSWPPGAGEGNLPVVAVDWCDARAYCAWAGKRLCGAVGGGPNAFGDWATSSSQWFMACSANGTRVYPYGATYTAKACSDVVADAGLSPVGTFPGCEGGYPGLFDMSANASEWEDSCLDDAGVDASSNTCRVRGGNYYQDPNILACNADLQVARGDRAGYRGFRCCSL